MKTRLTLLFIFSLIFSLTFGQSKTDSLLTLFNNNKANTEDCIELATLYNEINPDSGNYFAKIALELAIAGDKSTQIGEAYYQLADSYYYRDKYDSTLVYYKKSLFYYLKTNENNDIAGVYNDIGQLLQQQSKLDSSMVYFQQALLYIDKESLPSGYYAILINIANTHTYLGNFAYSNEALLQVLKESGNDISAYTRAILYNNIGLNYRRSSNYDAAIKYYNISLAIDDSLGSTNNLANDYMNIGATYYSWEKYDEALEMFNKAYVIFAKLKLPRNIASISADLANVQKALGNYEIAIEYFKLSIDSAKACNDIYLHANALHGLALVAFQQLQYQKSLKYGLEALELFNRTKRSFAICNTKLSLGRTYLSINNLIKAEIYLLSADSLSKEMKSLELEKDIAFQLASLYSAKGLHQQSNDYYQRFIIINDSVFNKKSHSILIEYQVKFDNLAKQRDVERISHENDINLERINQKNRAIVVLAIGSLVFFIMILFLWILYRQKNKSYKTLFIKNKEQLEADKQAATYRKDLLKKVIPIEISDKIVIALHRAMDDEKIFLQQDLSASKLAEELGTNTSYLSKIINDKFGLNFSAFINKYRIQEAQIIILNKDYKNYTIEAIAHECGYKSKSTFNEAFKRITGLTPSYYMSNKS